jgi:putative DNA primase/helicase
LPQLLEAVRKGETVYVHEGEKCCDAWIADGRGCATCNRDGVGGERHWRKLAPWFKGAEVVLIPDNDSAGRAFMRHVAWYLAPVARTVDQIDIYEDAPDREDGRDYANWRVDHPRRRAS